MEMTVKSTAAVVGTIVITPLPVALMGKIITLSNSGATNQSLEWFGMKFKAEKLWGCTFLKGVQK